MFNGNYVTGCDLYSPTFIQSQTWGPFFVSFYSTTLSHAMQKKHILVLTCITLTAAYSCRTHYKLADKSTKIAASTVSVERGKNLAFNICGDCHYNKATGKFIGQPMHDLPKFMGRVYSANLTQSPIHGVLRMYTDEQLAYLLKTGIAYDGRFIPFMLRPTMADADINDIIAYLHSKDAAVALADTSIGQTHLTALGRAGMRVIGKPQPFIKNIKRPGERDSIADGRYLVDIIGCFHCHSKSITKVNYQYAEHTKKYLQGGMKFKSPDGNMVHACNLTPDKETGTGSFTETDLSRAIRDRIGKNGRELQAPMPQFTHLTDRQVHNIYAYLQTLTPVHHLVQH